MKILLSSAYFAPLGYFTAIKNSSIIYVEQYENFGKQSYRNRCEIMTTNGVIALTVPVDKANSKTLIKDLKINYAVDWQKIHKRSIESAYRNSPYYDYYIDDILHFFENKERFLIDLNNKITQTLLDILQIKKEIKPTPDFIGQENSDILTGNILDLRQTFHPKANKRVNNLEIEYKPYHQTFSERIEFTPNLSILDLIFCCGPEAHIIL